MEEITLYQTGEKRKKECKKDVMFMKNKQENII